MSDGTNEERKPNPFAIPAQYANFVSIVYNEKEVVFQFGQHPTDQNDPLVPIAKIIMSQENALATLQFLDELKKGLNSNASDGTTD